ncbi:MAG: long-chain fatty acid--CoA ligase [Deltaproteobacteria bacterium]|nr:long-chain fatty acid--CoA ligase [Deltaproteobacteria bacterium]
MAAEGTIVGLFLERVTEAGDRPALLESRDGRWVSFGWKEWERRARAVAAALVEDGVRAGDHVVIFSYSRRQWVEADLGILMAGARTVTIYHNVNAETARQILRHSGAITVFAEGPRQVESMFPAPDAEPPGQVRRVVCFDEVVRDAHSRLFVRYEDFLAAGERALAERPLMLDARINNLKPGEVAKVIYTSGTTGEPKGAMLTHRNFLAVTRSLDRIIDIHPTDTCLLFLPLAHVYAQLTYHAALQIGFTLAFARSMLTAVEDAAAVRPHFFTSVPRLFEKIHAAAMGQVESSSGLKRTVFNWARGVGERTSAQRVRGQDIGAFLRAQNWAADRLVFSKLKARLGGRIRFMVSGGAPLARHVLEFFHAAGLPILEGYGMTENASLSHANRSSRIKFGTVGLPIPGVEMRIAQDGEILTRGEGTMQGYLHAPEATAEAIDAEGWLHTGDVGQIDAEGFLTITDRKKEIIVTSGGKNVAPAPIEAALGRSPFVSQTLVHGDGRKFLSALLTLDAEYVRSWAKERGIDGQDFEALAADPRVRAAIESEVEAVNRTLDPFSTIKAFAILPRDFSIEAGEMTPSLKLRRRAIEKKHRELLDGLYPPDSGSC